MPTDYTNLDFGCGDPGLNGVCRDCSPNPGGIMRIAIAPAAQIQTVTVSDEGVVTAIVVAPDAPARPFKEYWVNKKSNVSVFNTAFTSSEVSVGGTHQNDLILQLTKMSAITRAEYMKLLSGEFIALYQQRSDRLWFMLGVPGEPAEASAGDGSTGAAIADYNGYNLTLSTTSDLTPFEVDPELAESVISSCATGTIYARGTIIGVTASTEITLIATNANDADPVQWGSVTVTQDGPYVIPITVTEEQWNSRTNLVVTASTQSVTITPKPSYMDAVANGLIAPPITIA